MNAMTMNNEQNTAKLSELHPNNQPKKLTPAHYEELDELKLESVAAGWWFRLGFDYWGIRASQKGWWF